MSDEEYKQIMVKKITEMSKSIEKLEDKVNLMEKYLYWMWSKK